jgi:GT2 family glycosyltransferase
VAEPHLSVVVCTHDRPVELSACLEALVALEDPVEVVVVDSASPRPSGRLVERFAARLPGLRYVYEPVAGLSRARNRGLAESSGGLVAFVDDDAAVRRDWSRRIAAPFADASLGCVGGACVARFAEPPPRWLSERLLQFAGITRFRGAGREARSSAEYPFGANMCFRRGALEQVGGFSEALGRTGRALLSGEEFDAIERLRGAGWRVWLEPAAVVDHSVAAERCRGRYYWRRLWWQGVSRGRAERSLRLALRLAAAAVVRLGLWIATRDRVHLYRTAETAGYFAEVVRPARS